jgi:lipopolysaccharide/colanic/teichoic acid biosynthesis glycosyltransferase
MYRRFFKRMLDILASFFGIVILSPVLLVLWICVRQKLGSPAIFRQERPGKSGRVFTMYKFRSMTDDRNSEGELLPDEERLTPFGVMLRRTSLDELPELFNILRGDMSVIGPRPLLVRYLPRYSDFQARRHEVRPGLTGWAQVNGRNAIGWGEKFKLDVWYVDHVSFALDVRVFILTVRAVLKREGISQEGQATMGEFMGDE